MKSYTVLTPEGLAYYDPKDVLPDGLIQEFFTHLHRGLLNLQKDVSYWFGSEWSATDIKGLLDTLCCAGWSFEHHHISVYTPSKSTQYDKQKLNVSVPLNITVTRAANDG